MQFVYATIGAAVPMVVSHGGLKETHLKNRLSKSVAKVCLGSDSDSRKLMKGALPVTTVASTLACSSGPPPSEVLKAACRSNNITRRCPPSPRITMLWGEMSLLNQCIT